jgi:hypothetical protein
VSRRTVAVLTVVALMTFSAFLFVARAIPRDVWGSTSRAGTRSGIARRRTAPPTSMHSEQARVLAGYSGHAGG